MTDLKVGEFYNVTCAEIMMDDGRNYLLPIFDNLHADKQFGFRHEHYHIDGRFEMHPRMKHEFNLQSGHTASVILPQGGKHYLFIGIVSQELKCERITTGLAIPKSPNEMQRTRIESYNKWYESYIGKICEGRKCPHLGTNMIEIDGMLVCPLHNLTAKLSDLQII